MIADRQEDAVLQAAEPHQGLPLRPRVLVVSDVLLYREGVAGGLDRSGALQVLGAVSGAEAPALLRGDAVEAVLIDASSAALLPLARALRRARPDLPLIGFGIGSDDNCLACAEAGLTGFVGRDGTIAELVSAVEQALMGEVGCSPRLAALLCARVAALSSASEPPASPLTRREREVAELVSQGRSNKEIAIDLRIGPATVKNHIHNILEKTGAPRRSAIAGRLAASQAVPMIR